MFHPLLGLASEIECMWWLCFLDNSVFKRQIPFGCKGFKGLTLRQIVSSEIPTYLDDLQTSHQLNLLPPKIVWGCLSDRPGPKHIYEGIQDCLWRSCSLLARGLSSLQPRHSGPLSLPPVPQTSLSKQFPLSERN